jgi:hypothetical protein
VGTVEQSYYRWRKIYGGMKVDQARKYKDLDLENTRIFYSLKEVQIIVGEWVKQMTKGNPFRENHVSPIVL